MQEHHLRVDRHARYYTLGDPSTSPRELWYVCHGYAQLAARFIRHFRALDDGTRLIVAPEALNRFYLGDAQGRHGPNARIGATWMTREDRIAEITDYVAYLDTLDQAIRSQLTTPPTRIVLLGFSQGVATLARWIGLGTILPTDTILWGGELPPESEEYAQRLRPHHFTFVAGTKETELHSALTGAQVTRLEKMNLTWRLMTFEGAHELHEPTLLQFKQ